MNRLVTNIYTVGETGEGGMAQRKQHWNCDKNLKIHNLLLQDKDVKRSKTQNVWITHITDGT